MWPVLMRVICLLRAKKITKIPENRDVFYFINYKSVKGETLWQPVVAVMQLAVFVQQKVL